MDTKSLSHPSDTNFEPLDYVYVVDSRKVALTDNGELHLFEPKEESIDSVKYIMLTFALLIIHIIVLIIILEFGKKHTSKIVIGFLSLTFNTIIISILAVLL